MTFRRFFLIVIFLGLAVILYLKFDYVKAKYHDYQRKSAIKKIAKALDSYYSRYAKWPKVEDNDYYGWDLSYDGRDIEPDFLNALMEELILDKIPVDPINNKDYHFRYKDYPPGSFGCKQGFYILQINKWEAPNGDKGEGECLNKDFTELVKDGYTLQIFNKE